MCSGQFPLIALKTIFSVHKQRPSKYMHFVLGFDEWSQPAKKQLYEYLIQETNNIFCSKPTV